jgi:hypothetical protein
MINANVVGVIRSVGAHFWRLTPPQAIVPKMKISFGSQVRINDIFTHTYTVYTGLISVS